MIELSRFEELKESDLESLMILQKMLITQGLESQKNMTAYLKISELRMKLLELEFKRAEKIVKAQKRISDKLLLSVARAFDSKNTSEALLKIAEALSDFSAQTELSLIEAGYSLETHNTLEVFREKLAELDSSSTQP